MRALLSQGLSELGLDVSRAETLERFSSLLLEKNEVMNLTAITAPRDVATLHLLDCAALLTMADLRGKRVIDVGTGAGFPGMVLRILEPDFDLTLLDSLGKRVDWLGELCQELELAPERQTLLDALMHLNEKERQIVLLHKVSGMKHREIAELFQMPISTVLSVYHRAMKKLWERIEKSS